MLSFVSTVSVLTLALYSSSVAAFDAASNTNLVVYWGQGNGQKPLGAFCQDTTIDIIPIAFVNIFPDETDGNGYPGTNFGNACGGYYTDSNNVNTNFLASCPGIAADIVTCQNAGKKILLSLGGSSTNVFIQDQQSAIDFANFLWEAFGPVPQTPVSNVPRPFGTAVVDGFDFDIESLAADIPSDASISFGYDIMVNQLRQNFLTADGTWYISAAPQCIIPDAHLATALQLSNFDWVFVQFYNTPVCSARAHLDHTYGSTDGQPTDISFTAWTSWIQQNSQNTGAKIYLGLPADPLGTYGNMYLTPTEALEVTSDFFSTPLFGGIMLWEATLSDNNIVNGNTYAENMKAGLLSLGGIPATTSTTTTTTSTSTWTTLSTSTTTTTSVTSSYSFPTTPVFPIPTTSWSTTLSTTTSSSSSPSSTTTSSSTTYGIVPVGPESSQPTPIFPFPTTTSSSLTTTTSWSSSSSSTTLSTTSSYGIVPVGPESSQPTPSISFPTSSSSSSTWYTSSTSTSSTSTSSSSTTPWAAPASSSSTTATTTPSAIWTSSIEPTVTVISTSFVDICPTGFTTKPWVTTITITAQPTTTNEPANTHTCPEGFTTTVTVCTVCGPAPTTVTLTLPLVMNTMTVVPVAWSAWTSPASPATTSSTTTTSKASSISWPASKAWTTTSKGLPSIVFATPSAKPTSTKPSIWIPAKSSSTSSTPSAPMAPANTNWLTYKPTATALTMGLGGISTSSHPVPVAPVSTESSASWTTSSSSAMQSVYEPTNAAPFNSQFTGAAAANHRAFGGVLIGCVVAVVGLLM